MQDDGPTPLAHDHQLALMVLRLHLKVAMAGIDGEVADEERGALLDFVYRSTVTPAQQEALVGVVDGLIQSPPDLPSVLRLTVDTIDKRPTLAAMLVNDLVQVAAADGVHDPREEGLLRMVCDVLEIEPVYTRAPSN